MTAPVSANPRDYGPVRAAIAAAGTGGVLSREAGMRVVADALWDAFGADVPTLGARSVSWVGFYTRVPDDNRVGNHQPDDMALGPSRNKPACSPIGLHGACGQALVNRESLIVTDVAHLGAGYVACDPRDRSELVIACFDHEGSAWGVLDFDCWDTHGFDDHDADAVEQLLVLSGLSTARPTARRTV